MDIEKEISNINNQLLNLTSEINNLKRKRVDDDIILKKFNGKDKILMDMEKKVYTELNNIVDGLINNDRHKIDREKYIIIMKLFIKNIDNLSELEDSYHTFLDEIFEIKDIETLLKEFNEPIIINFLTSTLEHLTNYLIYLSKIYPDKLNSIYIENIHSKFKVDKQNIYLDLVKFLDYYNNELKKKEIKEFKQIILPWKNVNDRIKENILKSNLFFRVMELKDKYPELKTNIIWVDDKINEEKVKNLRELNEPLETIDDLINFKDSNNYNFDSNKLIKLKPILIDLKNLIGMDDVKKEILNLIKHVLLGINKIGTKFHTIITGNPGVGKTTLARILGSIYANLGLIKSNEKYKFVQAKRSDLIAQYVGQTAPKTEKILKSAFGGVLFIDEAYSLGATTTNDFSKECLDVINQYLDEHKDEFILILGGYKEPLEKKVLKTNPGFARRFTQKFNLNGYNGKELYQILQHKLTLEKFTLNDDRVLPFLIQHQNDILYGGGTIENIISKMRINYAYRIFGKKILVNMDFNFDDFQKSFYQVKDLENDKIEKEDKTYLNMYI